MRIGRPPVHGLSRAPGKVAWNQMNHRCHNPSSDDFFRYGGRGITVCDRWRGPDIQGFKNFVSDMGVRPSPDHSIERKDNDGPYSPNNCIWATRREQGANKRNNVLVTVDGETHNVAEWTRRNHLTHSAVSARIWRGWNLVTAITTPMLRHRHTNNAD